MKKLVFISLACLLVLPITKAQGIKMQALFIYNFSKLIEWPNSVESNNFKIGVFGSHDAYEEINGLLKGKQTGPKNIQIEYYNTLNEIINCHILFLPDVKVEIMLSIIEKFKEKPILIVTNTPGMIERGADINFKTVEGKQSYEISSKNIKSHNLIVSSKLVGLGISK